MVSTYSATLVLPLALPPLSFYFILFFFVISLTCSANASVVPSLCVFYLQYQSCKGPQQSHRHWVEIANDSHIRMRREIFCVVTYWYQGLTTEGKNRSENNQFKVKNLFTFCLVILYGESFCCQSSQLK